MSIEEIKGCEQPSMALTCEHATELFPPSFPLPPEDARLIGTHWAFDPGAADLTRELASFCEAPAVLSRFSRLLVDPNRPADSDTLFRDQAEGAPVHLNIGLDTAERQRRIRLLYTPYHNAVDRLVEQTSAPLLLSVHSFTPLYEGQKRSIEVGVLFDLDEAVALRWVEAFQKAGFDARPNEPYSGKLGLMYCVDHYARRHDKTAIELEVRQDLVTRPDIRSRLVEVIASLLD